MESIRFRSLASLATQPASCSPRCIQAYNSTLASTRLSRRVGVVVRAEYSRDPKGGPSQRQQARANPGSYDYAPQRSGNEPPRYPPGGDQGPPPPPEGNGGLSNITKAFVAGAFILGTLF